MNIFESEIPFDFKFKIQLDMSIYFELLYCIFSE